jgi:hypothetical protein
MDETLQDSFRETQWLVKSHGWLVPLIAIAPIVGWWSFVQQIVLHRPFGNNPGPDWMVWLMWALIGLVMPVLLLAVRMTVRVSADGLRVTYFPFLKRTIPFDAIRSCEAVTYRWTDFGGWGIRWSSKHGLAYTVGGNQDVRLELAGNKRRLVGSRRALELANTVRSYLRRP